MEEEGNGCSANPLEIGQGVNELVGVGYEKVVTLERKITHK
jgi:hypothetical protein